MPTIPVCQVCGSELPIMVRSHAKTCSPRCRTALHRASKRAAAERQANGVPPELRERRRWVRHASKRPLTAAGGSASTTDPATWSSYDAITASTVGDGFGYVLAAGDGVVVVDLDHCVAPDGRVADWAQQIVDGLPATYTERGASGTGLHLWFTGSVPGGRRIRRGEVAIEVYGERRYMVVGERVAGLPGVLAPLPGGVLGKLLR